MPQELTEIEWLALEYYEALVADPWIKPELWDYDKKRDYLKLSKEKLEKYLTRG